MQSLYPYRKQALIYMGILTALIVLGIGSSVRSNAYSSSSAMNSGLSVMAGLSFVLFAIFVIPFASFARKYWGTERIDDTSLAATPGIHTLSVKYSDPGSGTLVMQRNLGQLSWDNSAKIMYLAAGDDSSAQQEGRAFESAYGSIERFDINLGGIVIKVSGKMYRCTLSNLGGLGGGYGAGAALANIWKASVTLNKAGAPELVARLRVEGVPATYNKINKGFEYSCDVIFTILFIGMLSLVFFTI